MPNDFLQQFMAGWQMGQGRNENTRRDQELQMEQQRQQANLQQLQQEAARREEMMKLQKQELELGIKKHRFETQQKMADLANQAQAMGGVTAADQGIPEQAPEMAGPPTAQIDVRPSYQIDSPAGGPPVRMPILNLNEQESLRQRESQRKLLESLGMLNAQEGIKAKFKAEQAKTEHGYRLGEIGARVRGVQGAIGAAAPGFGGKLSETDKTKVEVAQNAIRNMPGWQKYLEQNKDRFGFYAGRITEAKQSGMFGEKSVDKETAKFTAQLAIVTNSMINALSGAAVSPQEFERLRKQVPELTDPPDVVAAKMSVLDDYFKFRLKNYGQEYQGSGWQERAAPETATAPGAWSMIPQSAQPQVINGVEVILEEP